MSEPAPLPAPVLTVAIATIAARLPGLRADHLPALPGLCYHVFVQGADLASADLSRPDIRLSLTEGRGAARNHKAALLAIETARLLFADDDLAFSAQGLRALMADAVKAVALRAALNAGSVPLPRSGMADQL